MRVNRRAAKLTVWSAAMLPMPVAAAVPHPVSLSEDVLSTMSGGLSVTRAGAFALPQSSPLAPPPRHRRAVDPSASVTRAVKGRHAAVPSPSALADSGIPLAALRAYRTAEATMQIADPSCNLSWPVLAGIGRVESDHGRYGGAVVRDNGVSTPHILGVALDGAGPVAAIADTDNGRLDGDTRWDRAVGPLQFIPSTWAMVGVDGDQDGQRNPHDLDDAALAAGAYLCVGERDLSTTSGLGEALYSYNHSQEYVAQVAAVARAYASGDLAPALPPLALPPTTSSRVHVREGWDIAQDDPPRAHRGRHRPAGEGGDRDRRPENERPAAEDRSTSPHDRGGTGPDRRPRRPGEQSPADDRNPAPVESEPTVDDDPTVEGPTNESAGDGSTGDTTPEGATPEPTAPETPNVVQPVAPAPEEFSGVVSVCEDGQGFCLGDHQMEGPGPFDDLVGQEVRLLGLLEGDTLVVESILG